MRLVLVLLLLLPGVANSQEAETPRESVWVGPLVFRDPDERAMPTRVEFAVTETTVTGRWTHPGGANFGSGMLTGTIDRRTVPPKIRFTATFFAGAERTWPTGQTEDLGPEYCQMEGRFEGKRLEGNVLRFTASRLDMLRTRQPIQACRPMTNIVWLLQLQPPPQ